MEDFDLRVKSRIKKELRIIDKQGNNIFNVFGFGVVSYFRIIRMLIGVYVFASIVSIGIIYTYYRHEAYSHWHYANALYEDDASSYLNTLRKTMMTNLGVSYSACNFQPIDMDSPTQIRCNYGGVIQEIDFAGITPVSQVMSEKFSTNYCGNPEDHVEIASCSKRIDFESLKIDWWNTCLNKT